MSEVAPGVMVTENVQLERRIAQGGMGSVWLARHVGLDMPVAVKFMSGSAYMRTPHAAERFMREARTAARIHHPNVVQILDFGCSPLAHGAPYIVMEYLEGQDLARYIAEKGTLPPDEVAAIVQTVARVLEKAHELGIVHRDIKPENVFLQGTDRIVKVLDFGVARDEKETSCRTTDEGEVVGTPYFMSPERFINPREVGWRVDCWALAVLAYEALVGRMPFRGDTPAAIYLAATQGHYEAPCHVRPELPQAVDRWFRTAFAVDPTRRFSSARSMAKAFVRAVCDEPAESAPVPVPAKLSERLITAQRRWDRRGAALSIGFISAVLGAAVMLARSPVDVSGGETALASTMTTGATAPAGETAAEGALAAEPVAREAVPAPAARPVEAERRKIAAPSRGTRRTSATPIDDPARRDARHPARGGAPSLFFVR
ncbi:protein kinase domain-containing protein [Pendulispora albinea]|uniref:Protein kinase n=1 Tax=Pendulispora albinea TaxID=2741071 RepID=A0ABZ2LWH6_9BACT